MQDSFRTIESPATTELRIERSRFIGTVTRAATRQQAEQLYAEIRKKYHDATHNCFAYRIGIAAASETRFSDDGEPSGTAGRPILDAIDSAGLTEVLVVITRYFGGVKLGTGGLARAYRETAAAVLAAATTVEELLYQLFTVEFGHDDTSIVMKLLADMGIRPEQTDYGDAVVIRARVRLSLYEQLSAALSERSRGRSRIRKTTNGENKL